MACSLKCKRAQSPHRNRPNMSDLRIVLVGKNESENNRVGNLFLNKNVFGKKTIPEDVEEHSEIVEGRNITVINTTHLLKSKNSLKKVEQEVSEICPPEPHVIILVLQHNNFSERKRDKLPSVLSYFCEQAMKRTMILTTDDETCSPKQKPVKENKFIQQISTECGGGRLQLTKNTQRSQILQKVDEIITRCKYKETQQISSIDQVGMPKVCSSFEKQKLILVLCGCNEELKASLSKLLLGQNMPISAKQDIGSMYVIEEEKIHGHQISLVELPALSQLSEEEVMLQTLSCASFCDPGVHAFIIVIPDAPLTDKDKAEMEEVQKIFDSREHFILLFITSLSVKEHVIDLVISSPDSQRLISRFGGQYRVKGLNEPEDSRQIPELLDYIENMKTEPYSLQMYVKTQENRVRHKTEEKYREEMKRMKDEIRGLQQEIQSKGSGSQAVDPERLRIVLIGKTGNGKSSAGNTILGRNEFESKARTDSVTTVCQKGVGEIDGRSVAVVDTPGLFDTSLSNDQVVEEIVKCVSLSSPGPHVFVIVLSVARFIQVEMDTVDLIKKIFGLKAAQFSIILFTKGDDLENESIEDYVRESKSAELKKLLRDCGGRFLAFNNRDKQNKSQVIQLLNMIEEVKNTNEGRYFTNRMFEEAEMSIKKRMEEILKEKEREIQKQIKVLQAKHEMDMKNLMNGLEDEKQKADKEKMKMEDQLREKEEKLRKEFEKTEQNKREIERKKQSVEKKVRAEYHQKVEEMKREIENQRLQYEKQQKEREEENTKRKEKHREEQEKMKHEQERILAELKIKQEEEIKKRDLEEKRRNEEEEEERQRWRRKIKEAENDRKEIQEEIKQQQKEWEDGKKRQMKEREEEERKRKERHEEELREKQEELEKMRKRFEREIEEERQNRENEREKQRREREEKEKEYEEKKTEIKIHYEQLEQERKEEWERKKLEYEDRREEERKRWKEMIEDLKRDQEKVLKRKEKEEKERKEQEEKERAQMKQKHDEEIEQIKNKHEDEARKQAEEFNESKGRKLLHVQQLTEMIKEHQEQQELLEKLYKHLKAQEGEEIKELLQKVEKIKNKPGCVTQ